MKRFIFRAFRPILIASLLASCREVHAQTTSIYIDATNPNWTTGPFLEEGVGYTVEASGAWSLWNNPSGNLCAGGAFFDGNYADAAYLYAIASNAPSCDNPSVPRQNTDQILQLSPSTVTSFGSLYTGPYNQSHFYSIQVTGMGSVLLARNGDSPLSDNSGGVNLTILPTTSISGHVYCSCDGSPIVAIVKIGNLSTLSDSSGYYSMNGPPSGTYNIAVSQDYYATTNSTITIPPAVEYSVTEDFTLTPNGTDPAQVAAIVPQSSIVPKPVNNATAIYASFTPANELTISQAACRLGVDHFNWLQWASGNSYRGHMYDCSITYLPLYFIDPPYELCDGKPYMVSLVTGGEAQADNYAPYFNEMTGAQDPFYWGNKVVNNSYIWFDDNPSLNIPGDVGSFVTFLIGVNNNETYTYLGQFQWITTFNGTLNNVRVLAASEFVLVRRGKVQDSRGRVNPTRQLTLQPVAVEASIEAMKCSKPLA